MVLGISTGLVFSFIIAAVVGVWWKNKKKSNQVNSPERGIKLIIYTCIICYIMCVHLCGILLFQQSHFESEEDHNHYDGVGPEVSDGMNEDVNSIVTNSYYGIAISTERSPDQTSHGNNESNEIERIKSTKNVYYEM